MQYRIVTNGKLFKMQRKGKGVGIKPISKHIPYLEQRWEYGELNIDDWTDVKRCDISEEHANTAFSEYDLGNLGKAQSVIIYKSKAAVQFVIDKQIEYDEYLENKDVWVEC